MTKFSQKDSSAEGRKPDVKLLKALRDADAALYRLWLQCYVDGDLFDKVNAFQKDVIHAAIHAEQSFMGTGTTPKNRRQGKES